MSVLLLIMDGLGGLPIDGKTELELAHTPHMDSLAKGGQLGLMHTIRMGVVPGSDVSHLNIFGYPPEKFYPGRGPLEALGSGINLREGDLALRANFATVSNGIVVDRRAGRIETKDAKKLESCLNFELDGYEIVFKSTSEHRGVLVIRGKDLSPKISDTDPHKEGSEWNRCKPLDGEAEKTASLINRISEECSKRLSSHELNSERREKGLQEANFVLLRGAGTYSKVPSVKERFGISALCIAGGSLYKGVSRFCGFDVPDIPGATGDKHTNLKVKAELAVSSSKSYDLVFLHVKATDSFGHDGNFRGKQSFIERVDREVVSRVSQAFGHIIITGDHSTPASLGRHSSHPVPFLLNSKEWAIPDSTKKFSERSCSNGSLGHFTGDSVIGCVLDMLGKRKKYGS